MPSASCVSTLTLATKPLAAGATIHASMSFTSVPERSVQPGATVIV